MEQTNRPKTKPEILAEVAAARNDPAAAEALRGNQPPKPPTADINKPAYKTSWSVADLLNTDFPDPKWIVPGLLPVGLSVLGGRPKVGKSWLGLQLALAVGSGGFALGEKIDKGKVLYLAYEDTARRLKNRLLKLNQNSHDNLSNCDIQFELSYTRLDKGGLNTLYADIEQQGFSFVVIDTFSRACGRYDQQDLTEMTEVTGQLQDITKSLDICILQIDHFRKPNGFGSDPIDDILGSTGKSAVIDAALGLYKEQGKRGAILKTRGRDIEEKELSLEFDVLTGAWQSLGDAGAVKAIGQEHEVITAIGDLIDQHTPATCAEIARHLGKDKGNIYRVLTTLENKGVIRRLAGYGKLIPYEIINK